MDNDRELLREFVSSRSEPAFAELVRRHVDMVYAAARRQIDDPGGAADVTQQVFVTLAQRATTIRDAEALAGWLLITTRFAALNHLRSETRRRRRETEAAAMNQEAREPDSATWDEIRPLLDETVAELKREDRDALTLRYFKGQSVAEVAAAMGVSEAAAQKRLGRAIDRLRALFARRGVVSTSDALTSALAVNLLASAAPAQLTAQIATAALSAAGSSIGTATKGAAILMATTKTKVAAAAMAAVLLAGAAAPVVYQVTRPSTPPGPTSPAAAAAAAPAATSSNRSDTRLVSTSAPSDEARARFSQAYALAPGQYVKRVLPPFIPEREAMLNMHNFRGGGMSGPIETTVFSFNGTEPVAQRFQLYAMDVGEVLKTVVRVWPQDTDIERQLLATKVPGDWVVRDLLEEKDAARDQRLPGVLAEMADVIGPNMLLRQETLEREVVVVRGKLQYTEQLAAPQRIHTLYLFRGSKRPQRAFNMTAGQTQEEVLQCLGEVIGRPIVIEADLGEKQPAVVAMHQQADWRRSIQLPEPAAVDQVLENVAQQTSLELKRETRRVRTWRLIKQEL